MSQLPLSPGRSRARRTLGAPIAATLAIGILSAGCQSSGQPPGGDPCKGAVTSSLYSSRLTASNVARVDLLLDVDNSRSMQDKQQILALAIPDLVRGFVNPPCINLATGDVDSTPAGPSAPCPAGTERRSRPVTDLHVGVISSSLGGHGSDACDPSGPGNGSKDDKGHLLDRQDPTTNASIETYQGLHFLAWDPEQSLAPPGEADLDQDTVSDPNGTALVPALRDLVIGVGQVGCGYEAQLESWYRFLVDPSPPEGFTLKGNGVLEATGVDQVLLDQRRAFLRPDSLLQILLLSDENDCSIRESGQFYLAAQEKQPNGAPYHLPRARAICDQSPWDECCFSCAQSGPKNDDGTLKCPADPTCEGPDGQTAMLSDAEDRFSLRCFDQKRRFGIDFLYSTDRYADALRSPTVTDRNGEVVPNPLFWDLDPSDSISSVRTPDMVFLVGLIGVPWQDIARTNVNGEPDLLAGLDGDGRPSGGFKSPAEMDRVLFGKDYSGWDVVIGDPDKYPSADALPKDPLMQESIDARTGQNPVTGDALVTSAMPLGNPINGHERTIAGRDDMQYACVFPLVKVDANGAVVPDKRDCSNIGVAGCDCADSSNDNPLCEADPNTGLPTMQVRAKAYPGLRELEVLRSLGDQAVLGSVCPAQLQDPSRADFGYRPALAGLQDRLKTGLTGQCLPIEVTPNEVGVVACFLVEATAVPADQADACNACDGPGRLPVDEAHASQVTAIQSDLPEAGFNCFCQIPQLSNVQPGDPLAACQYDPSSAPVDANEAPVDGFCYIDPALGIGDPAFVDRCPADERRLLRLVGAGEPRPGSSVFVTCVSEVVQEPPPECTDSP